jgi:hypothetical protein
MAPWGEVVPQEEALWAERRTYLAEAVDRVKVIPMALLRPPHDRIESLIREHLSIEEDEPTTRLIKELDAARERRYLTRAELEAVCYWKSPRAIRHVRDNTPREVRAATRAALATRSEQRRLGALTQLRGVSVPMASAVLTLLDPRRYGVIDIRVWQLLHRLGTVTKNADGVGFTFENWQRFLVIIRYFAKKHQVKARDIERTLFNVHRAHQRGRLYD